MTDDLSDTAKERAEKRGKQYIKEFQTLSKDEQIEKMAITIFNCTVSWLREGPPLLWDDLPLLASINELDKERFRDAARMVHTLLMWKE